MKNRYQGDWNISNKVIAGLRRLEPAVDFQSGKDANLSAVPDPEVLAFSARENRILVTHAHRTMPRHFGDFIATNESPGVIIVIQGTSLSDTIEALLLHWVASEPNEWRNRLIFLP